LLMLAMLIGAAAAAWADDPDNCLLCHQYRGLSRYDAQADSVHLFFTSPDYQYRRLGAHARVACTDCHPRDEVSVIPHKPVTRVNCTTTCHLNDATGLSLRFSHANTAQVLEQSVHNPTTFAKLHFRGGPLLGEGQSHCLYCHDEPIFRDPARLTERANPTSPHTFDRCTGCHQQVPVDVAYFLRHVTARLQPARPPLELAQACAVCHSDPAVLQEFGLPDSGVHYTSTFHGKAALLGSERTAGCIECHAREGDDAHHVLSKTDPRSVTYPTNKADTCRSTNCHPGADPRIGRAAVHLDFPSLSGWETVLAVAFLLFTLGTFGPSLVLTILELFQVVVGRQVPQEEAMRELTDEVLATPAGRQRLRRFTKGQRWQHWGLVTLFSLLVATGFPMKFAGHMWARHVIHFFGGLGNSRMIHHWCGVLLIVGFVTHLIVSVVSNLRRGLKPGPDGRRKSLYQILNEMPMFVTFGDMAKAGQLLAYLLFLRKKPPKWGRFSIDQKFEYLGVFWGTLLLGFTGIILWDAAFSSHWVSGRAFNLALIAHTYEAFLAVIHVGILHICHVMFAPDVFPFSPATLTGTTPPPRLAEVHGAEVLRAAKELGLAIPAEVQHD